MKRDHDPRPRKIIRKAPEEWAKITHYPLLDTEFIRGVDVFVTKEPAPLRYRIVLSAFINGAFRIPAVVAIANERRIRFGTAPVEFGILPKGATKVTEWLEELPEYRQRDVVISNPDFVEYRP